MDATGTFVGIEVQRVAAYKRVVGMYVDICVFFQRKGGGSGVGRELGGLS